MSKKHLMENEMDQAEAVLAAKSVTDTLQDMAEKIAKLEANNIMPLLDTIRMNFGPEYSDQLSADATTALQAVLTALKAAKEQIGANIDKMQGVITGEAPANDMANNVGVPGEAGVATPQAPNPDTPDAVAPEAPEAPAAPETGGVSDSDINDVFSDAPPAGRAKKESVQMRSINILRESSNPDVVLLAATVMRMRKGMTATDAIHETAEQFQVDAEDIVDLIRESRADEGLMDTVKKTLGMKPSIEKRRDAMEKYAQSLGVGPNFGVAYRNSADKEQMLANLERCQKQNNSEFAKKLILKREDDQHKRSVQNKKNAATVQAHDDAKAGKAYATKQRDQAFDNNKKYDVNQKAKNSGWNGGDPFKI